MESDLQRKIRRHLEREVGGFWFKHHGSEYSNAGIPDLIGCVRGLYFALEVKPRGETTSKIQDFIIDMISAAGGCACVVHNPDEALDAVRSALRVSKRRR